MMMANRPLYVLDASIAAKWFLQLPDEPHTEPAMAVFSDFEQGRVRLLAPDYIRAELGHALTRAVRRHRLSAGDGRESLERFYSFGIELVPHSGVLLGGYELALRYGCSFYDAGYLALSVMTGGPFLHADRKLRNTLAGRFPYESWIESYSR